MRCCFGAVAVCVRAAAVNTRPQTCFALAVVPAWLSKSRCCFAVGRSRPSGGRRWRSSSGPRPRRKPRQRQASSPRSRGPRQGRRQAAAVQRQQGQGEGDTAGSLTVGCSTGFLVVLRNVCCSVLVLEVSAAETVLSYRARLALVIDEQGVMLGRGHLTELSCFPISRCRLPPPLSGSHPVGRIMLSPLLLCLLHPRHPLGPSCRTCPHPPSSVLRRGLRRGTHPAMYVAVRFHCTD